MQYNTHSKDLVRHSVRQATHNWQRPIRVVALFLVVACSLRGATVIDAQDETKDFFRNKCVSCHSIGGGPRTGPDLKGVTERRSAEWLKRFIKDPKAVIASGDPDAVTLDKAYPKAEMPNNLGVTDDRAGYLIAMIAKESKAKNSEFGAQGLEPFQPGDIAEGKEIFLGYKRLTNRGVACVSCHAMYDTPSLGGGRLGPDLTNVLERMKGRESLETWLRSPNTETMGPIFAGDKKIDDDEIRQLAAYFEASAGESPADPAANRVAFLLMGLILATAIVFGFDAIWKKRFHSVRQPLVDSTPVRGQQ